MAGDGPSWGGGSELREIKRLRALVATMSEVSRLITESWDLDTVFQEVVDGARSLSGARCGATGVFDDSGRIRQFITSGMTLEERQLLGDLPQGLGILDYLNEIREPLRLADLTSHFRSVGFPDNDAPMKSFLGAPVRLVDESVGNIFLTEKKGGEFSRKDEETLIMFASQAANAIVNATPIYSDDGEIVSAVAVIQDMTPLEEMDRLRNEFLAMVSHELRTVPFTLSWCSIAPSSSCRNVPTSGRYGALPQLLAVALRVMEVFTKSLRVTRGSDSEGRCD